MYTPYATLVDKIGRFSTSPSKSLLAACLAFISALVTPVPTWKKMTTHCNLLHVLENLASIAKMVLSHWLDNWLLDTKTKQYHQFTALTWLLIQVFINISNIYTTYTKKSIHNRFARSRAHGFPITMAIHSNIAYTKTKMIQAFPKYIWHFFLFYFLLSTEKFRKETMAMALVLHFNSKSKQTECFPKTLQLHHDKLTREALVPTAKSFAPFLCKKTNCDFITKGHKATQCQLLIVNNTAEHRNSTLPK